jgi:predicted RNase H-like nuclease (RuvC/YqgF family)
LAADEAKLRRQLDELHRQMLDRDNLFRFHEREIQARDRQIHELREELTKIGEWAAALERRAGELETIARRREATIQEMEATIGWRAEMRLRSVLGRGGRP